MPRFFEPNNLTQEQKDNWDVAIQKYKKIQDDNLEYKLSILSQAEFEYYNKEGFTTEEQIRQKMRAVIDLIGNPAGHPKSSLFARLLEGKDALQYPPPTSYSYPWYSLIEDDEVHSVSIGGCLTLGGLLNWSNCSPNELKITINQCSWVVKSINNAARTLLNLDEELRRTAKTINTPNQSNSQQYMWTQEFFDKVKKAYAEKPEFIVKFGNHPLFRLYVDSVVNDGQHRRCRSKFLTQMLNRSVESMSNVYSVFDLDSLRMNLVLGKVVSVAEHPMVKLEKLRKHCAQNDSSDFLKKLDSANLERTSKSLQDDIAEYERDPGANDIVEYTADQWLLRKLK